MRTFGRAFSFIPRIAAGPSEVARIVVAASYVTQLAIELFLAVLVDGLMVPGMLGDSRYSSTKPNRWPLPDGEPG
jgi:hypothetical protein